MDIWIVLIEDRHTDVDPRPFTSEEQAIGFAREQAAANARHPEHIRDEELTPGAIEDGWVLDIGYSVESDHVRVVKRTMDNTDDT